MYHCHYIDWLMGIYVVPFAIIHGTAITTEEQVSMWKVRETLGHSSGTSGSDSSHFTILRNLFMFSCADHKPMKHPCICLNGCECG